MSNILKKSTTFLSILGPKIDLIGTPPYRITNSIFHRVVNIYFFFFYKQVPTNSFLSVSMNVVRYNDIICR